MSAGISFEQFARGVAAIDAYDALVRKVSDAFEGAGEGRVESLGGTGLVTELRQQIEERCNDLREPGSYGTMIEYMLYEGRMHGGRCKAADGREFQVNSPEALWAWWEATQTGPFTP